MNNSNDVKPEKNGEDKIRENENIYREIFNSVNDAIFIHDIKTGKLLDVNMKMEAMFGFTPEEAQDLKAGDISSGEGSYTDEEALKLFRKAAKEGPQIFEWHCRRKDGTLFWSEVNLKKGIIGGREVILAIERDITERKRIEDEKNKLQEQLIEAEKMKSLGVLAGGMAHDFNNLLQIIYAYTEILMMKKKETDQGIHELEIIKKTLTRATDLIDRMLLFSRKADSEKRPLLLNKEITCAAEAIKQAVPQTVSLELKLDESLWKINADSSQINQLLLNLANNAADAMPGGGKLIIETENAVLDDNIILRCAHLLQDKYVQLTVTDTGRGISAENIPHVFDPFFTSKKPGEGTGLGLASVYGIVKSHDGHICCYSQEGEGTSFVIYLPAIADEFIARPEEKKFKEGKMKGSEKILIVDDEKDIVNITSILLNENGYSTIKALSGEEALDLLAETEPGPDLVILDLAMPGMGGHKCLTEIKDKYPEIKVLVASGYSVEGIQEKITEKGASGFIKKPYNIKKLAEKIREILD